MADQEMEGQMALGVFTACRVAVGQTMSFDVGWMKEFEEGIEEMLDSLSAYLDEGEAEDIETPSGLPYCGCDTCHKRELIAYMVPRVLKAASDGLLALVEEEEGS